jgi:hypothetical protein
MILVEDIMREAEKMRLLDKYKANLSIQGFKGEVGSMERDGKHVSWQCKGSKQGPYTEVYLVCDL